VERPLRNPPVLILVAALALSVVGTLVLTSGMTFFQDTWAFLINRRELSVDAVLEPHSEHLVAFPALLEMLLIRIFGMSSALPEYVLLALFLAATVALLFVYLRRRVGDWLALLAALVVLTLGPAWEVLLWPFEITFIAPILFGLAMLLALEREDRLGDLAACLFLIVAVGSSGLGICFIAGAAVAVLIGPRETWLRRSYVFVVPVLLYAGWWIGWGHVAESHVTLRNILASPRFVADSIAWAMQSMFGLAPQIGSDPDLSWGRALLVGVALLLGYWLLRRPRPQVDPGLWPILAAAMANWFLTAFNLIPGRDPSSSRYQYAGVIFVLMIVSNLLPGVRPGKRTLAALALVTALAIGPNLVALKNGEEQLARQSMLTQADTAALEIAARTVGEDFQLTQPVAGTPSLINVYAGEYLEAVDEYGSPAYTEEELAAAPEEGRKYADVILSQALPLTTDVRRGVVASGSGFGCVAVPAGGGPAPGIPLTVGENEIEVPEGPPASISLRRFATEEFPVPTEDAPGGAVMVLRVPADNSERPWYLQVEAEQPVRVCPA
jgi:hypothetical protein